MLDKDLLVKLRCNDYGFECNFEVKGDKEYVVTQFMQHVNDEHGIRLQKKL